MTMVVAIWCRHAEDNIIGIGKQIPWHKPHDVKNFRDIIENQIVVCGRKTYESFENRTLGDNVKIYILTSNKEYEPEDKKHHFVITKQKDLETIEEDIYIAGGKEIYNLFFTGKEKFKPHIIVDCIYKGKIDNQEGDKIDITDTIKDIPKNYLKITNDYIKEDVYSSIWIKKGEFIEQSVLKRIINIIEKNT